MDFDSLCGFGRADFGPGDGSSRCRGFSVHPLIIYLWQYILSRNIFACNSGSGMLLWAQIGGGVPRVPITVMGFRCERCNHEWIPRDLQQVPAVCPKCKSPYWDR